MAHPRNAGYQAGNHWNTCQRCGFDIRASDSMVDPWKNIIVCSKCYEPIHPQLFVRVKEDDQTPKGLTTGSED